MGVGQSHLLPRAMKQSSLDLRLLSYFLKTAELGNITKAAAALNVAQPTLTKAIKLLEYQLGVTLFDRGPHGATPTAIGERLMLHAKTVMAQVGEAAADIESLRTGQAGVVRVGAGPSWVRRLLPEAVAAALDERPELRVSVSGGFDETLLTDLREGELDFVVAELPLSRQNDHYDVEVLTTDKLVVCARAGHPLAGNPPIALSEALSHRWVLPPPDALARQKFDGALISKGLPPPAAITSSSSLTFIINLVTCSNALTYTTRSQVVAEGTSLVALDVPEIAASRDAGLIFRKPKVLTPATEFVVALLRKACAGQRN